MDLDWIAAALGARSVRRGEGIQSLWGGHGELFRIVVTGGPVGSAVVKWARPPSPADDASSRRKVRSFEVEQAFYTTVAARCDDACRVARLLASRVAPGESVLVLEDLDAAGYPGRTDELQPRELDAALAWLAELHARCLGETFSQLWPIGTYWHLDTRRDELGAIEDSALRAAAEVIASRLAGARYQTLVHGDAKDANFCIRPGDGAVAAVDFQYTGRACAMVDVAYLLYGRADEPADGIDAARLASYFRSLRAALARRGQGDGDAIEAEWRSLYPLARLDFCRFLAGWRPGMWRNDARGQRFVRRLLPGL